MLTRKRLKTIESVKVYIKAEDKERAARIAKTISTCPVGVLFESERKFNTELVFILPVWWRHI